MIPLPQHYSSVPATYGSDFSLTEFGSKISVHHAKAGYNYPTILLPLTFSRFIGLSTLIYQTIYEGALAFLVVVSASPDRQKKPPQALNLRIYTAKVTGSNPVEPIFFDDLDSISSLF